MEIEYGVGEFSKRKEGNEFFTINGKKSNFQVKEFACKDGSDLIYIDDELVEKLQIMRDYFNSPITINSGYRTHDYNIKVGGAVNSQHVKGRAADIVVKGKKPSTVAEFAKKIGFRGVGLYSNFVHVDTRSEKSYWVG